LEQEEVAGHYEPEIRNKAVVGIKVTSNNNNNNNNYYYLLQLGCQPVAVVILHVYRI
jgi:hypothetical protein